MKKNKIKQIYNKRIIYAFIILLIILFILIPNTISIYNRHSRIKVNNESYENYKIAEKIYFDSKERIKNICHIEENEESQYYKLNSEFLSHKEAKLIEEAICEEIGDDLIVYTQYEVLQKKDKLKHTDSSLVYYAQLDKLYKNQISEEQYKIYFENTQHEIIYNYLLSVHNYANKEKFKIVNIKSLNAKQIMLNNYNLKLKYEIEELKFINNTIKYFEYYLHS